LSSTVITGTFPDELAPVSEKKGKDWLLQYAKAAYATYGNLPLGAIGWRSRDKYEEIKTYAQGRQSVEKYKRILIPGQDPSNNNLVVDWSVWPVIPKYRRISLGLMEKEGDRYDIRINPIDPLAKNELQKTLDDMRAKIMIRKMLEEQGVGELTEVPALMKEPGEPEDLDGVAVMETGIRHRTAMEAEQVVQLIYSQNNFDDIRRQYREDLFDYGVAFLKDDIYGNKVIIRRCDPRRMVMSYCTYPDFSDLQYIGEIREIPVQQLIVASNGQISKAEIEQIYKRVNNNTMGMNAPLGYAFSGSFSDFWNRGKVQVLDLELISSNQETKVETKDKRGNLFYANTSSDEKKRQRQEANGRAVTKTVQYLYRIKWIVGTDQCYDYGMQYDIKRDPMNLACAKFSYHIVGCNFYDMRTQSRTFELIPYADNIQLAAFKLQHALNSAVPKGAAIDISGLEDVPLSAGGEKLSPKELLDLYFQRGILLYRSKGFNGNDANRKWLDELVGGVGNEIAEFHNILQTNIELIKMTLGLNDLTDSSTPNPKTLTTIAQLAAEGSNNALSDLYIADRKLMTSVAGSVILRAQALIKSGKGEGFVNTLGMGTVAILANTPDIDKYIYGVSIEAKPTAEERAQFEQQLTTALQAGQITIADDIKIRNMYNQKQKELYLAYITEKNLKRQQQQKLEEMQQNGRIQVESAQAAEQAKQQTTSVEYELKMRLAQLEKDLEMRNLEVRGQYQLEEARIASTGRVESSYIQAKERQESNVRDNKTTLIKEGRADETDQIDMTTELKSQVEPLTGVDNPRLDVEVPEQEFSFLEETPEGEDVGMEENVPEGFDPEGYNALAMMAG
jgi:hypothetical protein